jgi:hypothetical protein
MEKKNLSPRRKMTIDELAALITDGFRTLIQAFEIDKRIRKLEDKVIGKNKK